MVTARRLLAIGFGLLVGVLLVTALAPLFAQRSPIEAPAQQRAYCARAHEMLALQATRLEASTCMPEARAAAARLIGSDVGKLRSLVDEVTFCARPGRVVDFSRRDTCWLDSLTATTEIREAGYQCLADLARDAADAIEGP